MIETIFTDEAPGPAGHYSQAVVWNDLIFISGQLPVVPGTGEKILGDVEKQTLQVLSNVDAILQEAGSSRQQVLKTTVYISDISLWNKVNEVYAAFFDGHKPARAVVPTKDLHFGFKIEIEAIAIKKAG